MGRPVRNPSLNQGQMTLPHHQPLQDLELISSAALLQAHVVAQAQAQNNAAQSAGGSGSVVYENSYNSFQRLVSFVFSTDSLLVIIYNHIRVEQGSDFKVFGSNLCQ